MMQLDEQYIIDKKGNRTAVILKIEKFQYLLEKAEKYEVIEKEYDCIDVTENLKEAFKNIKDGETYPIEGLWDELSD